MNSAIPRITIVMPNLNNSRYLEQAVGSIISQNYQNLEFFFIDGGSTDGSLDFLCNYFNHIDYWVSEPDKGQSEAIVKGFDRATGDLMNWLNSDDLLLPNALWNIARAWEKGIDQIIVGRDHHFTERADDPSRTFIPAGYEYPDCVKFWSGKFKYHQPCTFFTRHLYERAGGLDRNLHYAMDFDLYCRMLSTGGVTVKYLDEVISAFRLHTGAKTARAKPAFLEEQRHVARKYWQSAGLGASDRAAMDRHSAECRLHHMAEAFRGRRILAGMRCLFGAMLLNPRHAITYLARKVASKLFTLDFQKVQ